MSDRDVFDFVADDGSFGLWFDRKRNADCSYADRSYTVHRVDRNADGLSVFATLALARDAGCAAPVGTLQRSGLDRAWVIRDGAHVLVSPADGIGGGACTTRDEAVTVLGWKIEGKRR